MTDEETKPSTVVFRRSADGVLEYEANLSTGDDDSALSIIYWQDRGTAAIFAAADEMRETERAWRKATIGLKLS